jgi:hypothetical protein
MMRENFSDHELVIRQKPLAAKVFASNKEKGNLVEPEPVQALTDFHNQIESQ